MYYSGRGHNQIRQGTIQPPPQPEDDFIPNPHQGDIGVALLRVILAEAGVSRDEWEGI